MEAANRESILQLIDLELIQIDVNSYEPPPYTEESTL